VTTLVRILLALAIVAGATGCTVVIVAHCVGVLACRPAPPPAPPPEGK